MAKVTVLAQCRSEQAGKLQLRGVFTQKKKLWEVLEPLATYPVNRKVVDDVTGKAYEFLYRCVCDRLRTVGRATILDKDGKRDLLIVETELNKLRDWDTGDDGIVKPNPAGGEDDEKTG